MKLWLKSIACALTAALLWAAPAVCASLTPYTIANGLGQSLVFGAWGPFGCSGSNCVVGGSVPMDTSGNALGISANPFYMICSSGCAGGSGGNVNINQILGAAPSATNPLWVSPATGATFPVSGSISCSNCSGSGVSATFGSAIGSFGTPGGFKDGSGNFQPLLGDVTNGQWVNIKSSVSLGVTGTFWPYTLGQQVNASSVPVVLTATQLSTLTPPAAITNYSLETGGNLAQVVTDFGAPGSTACTTDTASCSLNQQMQRLAQRLTTINTTLGAPFQAGGNIGNTSFGISGTLPAFASTPTFNLGTLNGAATATNQTGGGQKTQIVDGSGNVIGSTSNNLNVQCANCSGSGASGTDEGAFTAGSSVFAPVGGFFQTTATSNPLANGQWGAWQLTANRAGFVNLRNASGTEIGTSSNPVQVTGANGTFPVSGTVTANLGTLNGASTAANQTSLIGPLAASAAAATNAEQVGGQFLSTQPTMTNTQQAGLLLSSRGELLVAPGVSGFNVINAGTFAVQATQAGNWPVRLQDGSGNAINSTSNALNVNISSGNITGFATAANQPTNAAIGSTTSGQTGNLHFGAVTSAAPTYTTGQSDPLSLTTAGALRVDGSAVTQPVSIAAAVTVAQATAGNLNATVVNGGTFAVQLTGATNNINNISGTISLPTGAATSANQPTNAAQGSTTSGQTGGLMQGAVTTAAPTYTTGQTDPLSLDTAGNLRVNCVTGCSGGGGGGSVFGPTAVGSAIANPPVMIGGSANGTGTGNVSILEVVGGVGYVNNAQVNGVAVSTGAGATGTGTQRVGVAQDTTTIAGSAPGTAGSPSSNVVTVQGASSMTPLTVTQSSPSTASVTNPTSTLTLPATTTAYGVSQMVANNATGTSVTVPSFSIANSAGAVNLCALVLTTNDSTSTAWGGQGLAIDLWRAAPTFASANGDRGTYLPATGSANYIGTFTGTMQPVMGDGTGGRFTITSGGSCANIKLASGTSIFWTLYTLTGTAGVTGASKVFTLTAEVTN